MLALAVELENKNLVQLLLETAATVTSEESLVPHLMIAVLHRHRGNVQVLLNARADPWQAEPICALCDHPWYWLGSCRDGNASMQCKFPLHRTQRIQLLTYSPKRRPYGSFESRMAPESTVLPHCHVSALPLY